MAAVVLGDVLDRGREFGIRLEAFYADLRDRSRDNGVRLLTYYLARHRRHQDQALANCDKAQIERLRKAEVQCDVASKPEEMSHLLETPPEDVTAANLLLAAARYDQGLIDLYRSILDRQPADEVRTILEALVRMEERDLAMIKKMIAARYF